MRHALGKLSRKWRGLPVVKGDPEVGEAYDACADDLDDFTESHDFDIANRQFELGVALSRVLTLTGQTTLTFVAGEQSIVYALDADAGMLWGGGATEAEALNHLGDKLQERTC